MNEILQLDVIESGSDIEEPVSLDEAKAWLKIDWTDQDDEITRLIGSAREAVENYTSCSLIEKSVTCTVKLCGDYFELPYGPVVAITEVTQAGNTITDYDIIDGEFPKVYGLYGIYTFTYTVGYGAIPKRLKEAILNEVAYRNQNRGDQSKDLTLAETDLCGSVLHMCRPFKRMAWL